jgi:branched-chain amino acid transport system substrate-binding protein
MSIARYGFAVAADWHVRRCRLNSWEDVAMANLRRSATGILCAAVFAGWFGVAAAEDTIKVGACTPMTGPGAETGQLQSEGTKLAVARVNAEGGVLGRKMELIMEDDQTSNPGIVLCFSRLASRGDLVAVLSSQRSTQVNAMLPDAKKAGIPVFIGGTDPTLTHAGNPWYFRTRPNDTYSAMVMAEFGVSDLGKKKWAVVHSADAFGTNGAKQLIEQLKAKGITPVTVQSFPNGQSDITPVVLAIQQSGADILGTYIAFENDVAVMARQMKQLNVNPVWIGSASLISTTTLDLAKSAIYGVYSVSDFNAASSPQAKAYYDEFMKKVGRAPDQSSAWAYDAITLIAEVIRRTGSTEPEKLRTGLLGIKNFPGVEGTYSFDENGDGLRGYNVMRNEDGKIVFVRHIDFEK